jgi:hypothetical protein
MGRFNIVKLATIINDNQISFDVGQPDAEVYFFGTWVIGQIGDIQKHQIITKDGTKVTSLDTVEWSNSATEDYGSYLEVGEDLECDERDYIALRQAIITYVNSIDREVDAPTCPLCSELVYSFEEARSINGHPRGAHVECLIRSVAGSVGHQKGQCLCYTLVEDVSENGMSRREGAIAAYNYYMTHNPGS